LPDNLDKTDFAGFVGCLAERVGVWRSVMQLTWDFGIYLAVELYKVFDTPHDRLAFFDYSTDMQELNSAAQTVI
jgi:hypothetical protein